MKLVIALLFGFYLALPTLLFAQEPDSSGVVILADARLEALFRKPNSTHNSSILEEGIATTTTENKTVRKHGVIRSARGYRIQIYNGNDRNKAIKLKIECIRRFPKLETYMTYIQPQFRVKVGNFTTRGEAQKFVQQMSALFSPIMIVPDFIVINTFKND